MVGVYQCPLLPCLSKNSFLNVNEVATTSVTTVAFLGKGMTSFCLVGTIGLHVYAKLLRTMSKLAFVAVGTVAFLGEVFAEGAFCFRGLLFRSEIVS